MGTHLFLLPQVVDDHVGALHGDADADVSRLLDPLFEQVQDGHPHLAQADGVIGTGQVHGVLTVSVGDDEQPVRHGQSVLTR